MNPNRLLKDFQALLRRAVGETVEIRFDLDAVSTRSGSIPGSSRAQC